MVRGSKNVIGLYVCLVMASITLTAYAIPQTDSHRCLQILRNLRKGSASDNMSRLRSSWNVEGAEETDLYFYDAILIALRDQKQPRFGELDHSDVEELFHRALNFPNFLAQLKLKFKEVTGEEYELINADSNTFPLQTQVGDNPKYRNLVVQRTSTRGPVLLVSITNGIQLWKRGLFSTWIPRNGESDDPRDYKWEPVR